MGLFGKKREVVDLRPKDSDMPIPAKMRDRLIAGKTNSSPITATIPSTESNNSGGGFFGFFGDGDSSSNNSSSTVSPPVSSTTEETKIDFWGNPIATASSSSISVNNSISSIGSNNDSPVGEMAYKLSRMTDRLELVEKKLGRMERKLGITSGND